MLTQAQVAPPGTWETLQPSAISLCLWLEMDKLIINSECLPEEKTITEVQKFMMVLKIYLLFLYVHVFHS